MNRDMTCVDVAFEAIENRKPRLVRQTDIENDRARHILFRKIQRFLGCARYQGLESHFARKIAQNAGKGLIIFNEKKDALGARQRIAVIIDFLRNS